MRVLGRNVSQSISIYTSDGLIQVRLTSVAGQQARIGIEAPASVDIVRSEVDTLVEQNDEFATR